MLTAVEFGPIFVLDLDNKLSSHASRISANSPEALDLIEYETCRTFEDIIKALAYFNKNIDKFATLGIDTWSRYHEITIDAFLRTNPAKRATTKNPDGTVIIQPSMPDWFSIKAMNRDFIRKILALDANVIVNTHVGTKEINGESRLTVGTSGAFGQSMPEFFAETHQLRIDMNGQYRVRGKQSPDLVANTSLPSNLLTDSGQFKDTTLHIFKDIAKTVSE
jgi:hypothetical protein